ncbi:MAG: hypothetical protein R2860_02735 [Desulfobacterales bacterium]
MVFANIFKGVRFWARTICIRESAEFVELNQLFRPGRRAFLLMFVQHGLSWLLIKTEGAFAGTMQSPFAENLLVCPCRCHCGFFNPDRFVNRPLHKL